MCCLCSDEMQVRKQKEAEEDEEIEETPQEKKLRLAKLYLEQLREEGQCEGIQLLVLYSWLDLSLVMLVIVNAQENNLPSV